MSATPEWEDIPRSQLVRDRVKRDRENPRAHANLSPPSSGNSSLDAASDGARSRAVASVSPETQVMSCGGKPFLMPFDNAQGPEASSKTLRRVEIRGQVVHPLSSTVQWGVFKRGNSQEEGPDDRKREFTYSCA
jgi:hypothetical protein